MKKYITKSFQETQKLGQNFARLLSSPRKRGSRAEAQNLDSRLHGNDGRDGATVLALQGNLGGGKTTFLQGFAHGLGIKEKITSPTYVILKHFRLPSLRAKRSNLKVQIASSPEAPRNDDSFTDFYHIDCYRINKPEEILELGFEEIISDPKNIVAIEWPEKIKELLPKDTIEIEFKFVDEKTREINFKK
jgi:tRNA threonylcarbamoyladenosine biosynthesis protein TsaE